MDLTRTIRDQCHSKEGDDVSRVFLQDQEQYNLKNQQKMAENCK